uniref:XPG-I domain-containing protein n=2 Tax=Physcomitrium patens TaxID=3218 RepID=A0A7I4EW98_PHYPA
MKIAIDVNALMFIISKYVIHHCIIKKFSLNEVNDILRHEEFEMAKYSSYCIDMVKKAIEILRDEFYCVFVFDRKKFLEKQLEIERRSRKHMGAKETLATMRRIFQHYISNKRNTKQYYDALFECIELSISEAPTFLHVCAVGEYEADVTCAHICQSKEVYAVLSSDYDSLLFGCPYLIKDIDMIEGYADVIILQNIYNHFNIDHSQAIDICILMDTDYNKKMSRIGLKTALVEIQSHGKLENTKYYNKKEFSINRLRQIYNCIYSKEKVSWFLIKAKEEFNMLEDSIKIL